MKVGVVSVTSSGDEIARKLGELFEMELYSKKQNDGFSLGNATKEAMERSSAVIFISSTGIAVRAIAPFIRSKDIDPAVIVIDASGRFVISLLSGHIGGANELTLKIAEHLGAEPVITTATDNMGIQAPDVVAGCFGLIIEDLKKAKAIAALLVEGKKVAFIDEREIIPVPEGYIEDARLAEGIVYVTDKTDAGCSDSCSLRLIRRDIVIGIGCRRDYDPYAMIRNVDSVLKDNGIDKRAVVKVATAEVKRNEKAVISLAESLKAELEIHSLKSIKRVQDKYEGSSFAEASIGVKAVCEPCVELSRGGLLTGKIAINGMTICIGRI